MQPTLDLLVEELRRDGPDAFRARYDVPVLLRKAAARDAEDDEDRSFNTDVRDRRTLRETLKLDRRQIELERKTIAPPPLRAEEKPARTVEIVHPVRKRPGGAFQDRIGIGRAGNADITIPLPALSKYHAYFTVPEDPAGDYTLTDASSKNGTWVDRHRLDPKEPHPVHDRSTIRVGPYEMTFHTPEGLLTLLTQVRDGDPRP